MDGLYLSLCMFVLLCVKTESLLLEKRDCRRQEGGPYYFKKVDSKTYKCVRNGPEYKCPPFWAIPSWYMYGSSDPCVCKDLPKPGYDTSRWCPEDPMAGIRTTQSPVTAVPMAGTIADMGCPNPFQRYESTLRIFNLSNSDVREFPIGGQLGFLTAENECKYHCLAVGNCAGVTYSEQNGVPVCVGFFITATSYDFRGVAAHSYFEKVWCVISSRPVQPTPPPIEDGLLLQNTRQAQGDGKVLLTNVDEMSCYLWCYYEDKCAAVDYNKEEESCRYYSATSCDAHEPALDHCCNHYKKQIASCP